MSLRAALAAACLMFVLTATAPVSARPLLVDLIYTQTGYADIDQQSGATGTIYSFGNPNPASQTDHPDGFSMQLAADAAGRPYLLRLASHMGRDADAERYLRTATRIFAMAEPATGDIDAFSDDLRQHLKNAVSGEVSGDGRLLQGSTGATLTVLNPGPDQLAVLDFTFPGYTETRLEPQEVRDLISGATLTHGPSLPQSGPMTIYHAPNGLWSGVQEFQHTGDQEAGSDKVVTSGSWHVGDDGSLCYDYELSFERCMSTIHRMSNAVLAAQWSASTVEDRRDIDLLTVTAGNTLGLDTPYRADSIVARAVRPLISGKTEERRIDDDGVQRLYYDPNGALRGVTASGMEIAGVWTVEKDGRRCIAPEKRDTGDYHQVRECAFLVETDGGTFRHYDRFGKYLGEALYLNGNPNGF